jgi:hypothetical protein
LGSLVNNDRITDPNYRGINLSTPGVVKSFSEPPPPGSGYGRTFIFAVSEGQEIHVAADSERALPNAVKHETLFHNADVLAAGEICIRDGVIFALNDHSGSYGTVGELETNSDFARAVLSAFDKHRLPVDPNLRSELENLTSE